MQFLNKTYISDRNKLLFSIPEIHILAIYNIIF